VQGVECRVLGSEIRFGVSRLGLSGEGSKLRIEGSGFGFLFQHSGSLFEGLRFMI